MSNFDSQKSESTLFIDVGNSSVKVGFKSNNKWKSHTHKTAAMAANQINNHTYPVQRIYLSSVREAVKDSLEGDIESHLIREINIRDIQSDLLDYETTESLGIDRYLACLGAKSKTSKAAVVIDAGSACTIDYIDEKGVFRGGVIMPGLSSVLTIFAKSAPELPSIDVQFPKHFPGKTTKESLELGQVVFFADGVSKMLERYSAIFGDYELFISGGDADTVFGLIGNKGTVEKHLIFDGMEKFIEKK
ncbi:MAG: type III pantothenate kinase [Balneolaceae bacterium]